MEAELTHEEKIEIVLSEADSFARFIVTESARQRRTKFATYMAVAYLSMIYQEKDFEIWEAAIQALELVKDKAKKKEAEKVKPEAE